MTTRTNIDGMVDAIDKAINSDTSISPIAKDGIMAAVTLIGVLLKDIHRMADAIERIADNV